VHPVGSHYTDIPTTSRSPNFSLSFTTFNPTRFTTKRVIPGGLQAPTSSACPELRRALHTFSQHKQPHRQHSGMHFSLTFVHHRDTNPPALAFYERMQKVPGDQLPGPTSPNCALSHPTRRTAAWSIFQGTNSM
jgi:hypothetical protein